MMNDELISKLKYLRFNSLLSNWDLYLKLAANKGFSHDRLLTHVINEEYRSRQDRARQLRLDKAHIPEPWTIETYPFDRQPKLSKKKIFALYDSLGFMKENQNIIWLGGTGCGKTGLATSFLIHTINHGYSGRFITFPELVEELYRSIADHSEARVLKKFLSYDCLYIDEIGYIEVEPAQVGQFFTLMQRRHKKQSTLLTSNLGFSEWGTFLKNAHLTAALIDRLTENSHIINMKECRSLRNPPAAPQS